jgi:hypothetical protein
MRLEDLGKKLFADASPLDNELILQKFEEFFSENPTAQYFILLSKEVDYYTVFKTAVNGGNAESLLEYFSNSWFGLLNEDVMVPMKDIVHLEIREDGSLEIWIQSVYFHLAPFDWGVEQL